MNRLLLYFLALLFLGCANAVTATATTLPVTDPLAGECEDGIDNDGDGKADFDGVTDELGDELYSEDTGCLDDDTDSERRTLDRMFYSDAVEYLREVGHRDFGWVYDYGFLETHRCKRLSGTRFKCASVWIYGNYIYAMRARFWHHLVDDEVWWSYHMRGWKLSERCANRPFSKWNRCAKKRYLVR